MKSFFFTTIVAVVALGGYFYMHNKSANTIVMAPAGTVTVQTAWVEVTADSVYLDVADKKNPLKSGDSVRVGAVIETSATGTATIHFPDGSLARMDSNTTLTLSTVSFNPDNNSLMVHIGLTIGRVWSKVIGLATPESSWEVQTSNTVATVRGTAFGVGHKKDGTSWVLGSQHIIAVAPIDPKTGKKIAKAEILLNEDRLIQLTDTDAAVAQTAIGSSTIAAKVTPIIGTFKTDAWILGNQASDKKFDAPIDALRSQGALDTTVRNAVHVQETQLQTVLQQKSNTQPPVAPSPTPTQTPNTPVAVPQTPATTASASPAPATAPVTTVISTNQSLSTITEGDTIQFKATTGTTDVTNAVTWSVTGPIGSISSGGLFTALLDSSVSEIGLSIGFVSATLKDGTVIKGPLFYVSAKVVAPTSTTGQ